MFNFRRSFRDSFSSLALAFSVCLSHPLVWLSLCCGLSILQVVCFFTRSPLPHLHLRSLVLSYSHLYPLIYPFLLLLVLGVCVWYMVMFACVGFLRAFCRYPVWFNRPLCPAMDLFLHRSLSIPIPITVIDHLILLVYFYSVRRSACWFFFFVCVCVSVSGD